MVTLGQTAKWTLKRSLNKYGMSAKKVAIVERWPLVEVRLYSCLICSVNILSKCFHSFVV